MIDVEALSGVLDADRGSGLVKVGGGTVLAELNEELARARAGDGEPRRHRPPDDRRRDLDRHPRHRRQAAQHLRPGRGDRAGPRRRQRPRAERGDRAGAAAGGAGRGRRARRDLRGDPALRPGLHPRPGRRAAPARGGPRHLPASAPTPTTTSSSSPSPTPTRALVLERNRTDGPPRPRGRAAAYLNDVVLENWALEALSATGKALAAGDPVALAAGRRGSPPAAARSTAATASSSTSAASASPRWSTGCRASTGRRRRGG